MTVTYVPVVVVMPAADVERLAAHTAEVWLGMPAEIRAAWDDFAFAHGWTRESIIGGQLLAKALGLVSP